MRYALSMITNFKCSETEKIFNGIQSRKLPANIQSVARRKLRMLNNSVNLDDLRIPPAIIDWNHWKVKEKVSIVFVSISNGVSVLSGTMAILKKLR